MTGAVHCDNAGLMSQDLNLEPVCAEGMCPLFQFQEAVTQTTPFETGKSKEWKQLTV